MDGIGEENYSVQPPSIIVGNLFVGEKFIEPYGECVIKNETNGYVCKMNFLPRPSKFQMMSKEDRQKKTNSMSATIEDA